MIVTTGGVERAILSLGRCGSVGGVTFGSEHPDDLDAFADGLLKAAEHLAEAMPLVVSSNELPDQTAEEVANCLCTVISLANAMRFNARTSRSAAAREGAPA